jgi:hypothetical protein
MNALLLEKVRARTTEDPATNCWLWQAAVDKGGYSPIMRFPLRLGGDGKGYNAYKLAYIATNGPVPSGLELHHTCHNTRCCNPAHLVAVTHTENILRRKPSQPKKSYATPARYQVNVCLGHDDWQALCRYAKQSRLGLSAVARMAIVRMLDNN